jgi:hypothetical protein
LLHWRQPVFGLFRRPNRAASQPGKQVPSAEKSRPEVNRRWTDTDSAHDERGLKHRASDETRRVPIPPELVVILRAHIDTFGAAPDGRIFSSDRGHPSGPANHLHRVRAPVADPSRAGSRAGWHPVGGAAKPACKPGLALGVPGLRGCTQNAV